MSENKKEKFKWENLTPTDKCDFEKTYNHALQNLYSLQSLLQQLGRCYKEKMKEK
ncbi:MAG: hypothetical protein R3Y43_02445 [Alphaproteobacteria bacterium]